METLIVEPKSKKQLNAIKAVLKALDVTFRKEEESPYNPEFVAKIKKSEEQFEKGEYITLDPSKSLWENIESIDKTAQKELQEHYKSSNKPLIKKIEQIFDELAEHPETGTGKPEILKYNLSGSWSRRLNGEHRIVYKITDDRVLVSSVKDHY